MSKSDESCIQNEEFCIQNEELCRHAHKSGMIPAPEIESKSGLTRTSSAPTLLPLWSAPTQLTEDSANHADEMVRVINAVCLICIYMPAIDRSLCCLSDVYIHRRRLIDLYVVCLMCIYIAGD